MYRPTTRRWQRSSWMFGSIARLGRIDATLFTPDQIELIGALDAVDVIEVRDTTDFFGHRYFVSNPERERGLHRAAAIRFAPQRARAGRWNESPGPFGGFLETSRRIDDIRGCGAHRMVEIHTIQRVTKEM